jgi:hypothetical protein
MSRLTADELCKVEAKKPNNGGCLGREEASPDAHKLITEFGDCPWQMLII